MPDFFDGEVGKKVDSALYFGQGNCYNLSSNNDSDFSKSERG